MPIEGKANLNKDHSFTDFPITISNNVKSGVSNWSMLGNGQQTGTPTPDAPIMPEFVGVRTGNLLNLNRTYSNSFTTDTTKWMNGAATVNNAGTVYAETEILGDVIKVTSKNPGYGASFLIKASPNTTYTVNFETDKESSDSWGGISDRDINGTVINQQAIQGKSATFTTHSNCAFLNVCFRFPPADGTVTFSKIMLNLGSTALPYEPYGYKIPLTCTGQTTPVYLGQTPTVRRVKKTEINIDRIITLASGYVGAVTKSFTQDAIYGFGFCDVFPHGSSSVVNSFYVNKVNAVFVLNAGTTLEDAKELLNGHFIWYILTEPETGIINEPLAKIGDYADELLSTAEGTPQLTLSTEEPNIISFETNLQPSKFNIKYYEKDYTKIKDIQMQIPTAKTYNYTEYPITINNAVSSNCNIDLFGNGIQNGTPSPDNPIIPEFCGDKTRNLWDGTEYVQTSMSNPGTWVYNADLTGSVYRVPCKPNTTYTLYLTENINLTIWKIRDVSTDVVPTAQSTSVQIAKSHAENVSSDNSTTFTTSQYAKYILFQANASVYSSILDCIMLVEGSTTLPYEPYGYKIPFTNSEQTNTVYLGEVPTAHRIKKLVLKGDEGTWKKSTTYQGNFYNQLLNTPRLGIPILCSHAVYTSQFTPQSYVYGKCGVDGSASVKNLNLFIGESSWSVSDFQQYLATQYVAGTPVTVWYVLTEPETGIVNEPLAKIGDYSDELQTTIQLEPFKQNIISIDTQLQPSKVSLTYKTKESTDPYKSIKYVLDNNNNYIYKSPYFYTWEGIREIVRAGKASQYYPIGSIIYDNFDESTGTAFQVVAYDNHFDPTLTAQGYAHSMTLCELLLTDVITFDAQEAFLYTEVDIPAGTYKFTIPNYDATYGGDKTYYFTSTTTLPSGSQIVMNWPYQQTPKTVTGYTGPNPQTNTTALSGFSALTLTEWIDGTSPEATDLGTIAGPTTQLGTSNYGQMNHIHRARYGSNNYLQSGIRQYINSNSAANTWWTPQTVFDRPYGSRTSAGKLTKLNQDLVSVMATPEIKSRANSYFETTSLDGTTFTLSTDYTINTDKMFLLSPMEVNFNTTDTTIGTTLDYYIGADNNKRIKIRKSNNTAYYWWLRTPYPSITNYVRYVLTSGALSNYSAHGSLGAAPACIIQ